MSTEIPHVDRLLRKRNQCLQHQLDVKIQIFDKEFKMCKSRVNNEIRDCNLFYKTVRSVYPGLDNYSHPDTRSMAVNQEAKHKMTPANCSTNPPHVSRHTVCDSRHIARANKSQIETSIYSTYAQGDKEHRSIAETPQPMDGNAKGGDLDQESAQKPDQSWSKQSSVLLTKSLHPSTNTNPGDDIPENEHPITTLVRTMRQRILSAPPVTKVQFYSQCQRPYRPKTAIGCIQEKYGQNLTRHGSSLQHSHKHKSNTSTLRCNSVTPRSKLTPDQVHSLNEPGLSSDKLITMEYMKKARYRHASEEDFIRRPKSAPPSYELLGKSPALPRQQVAGIMAAMENRRAATRALIDKSKLIQKQVNRMTKEHGIMTDDEDERGDEVKIL